MNRKFLTTREFADEMELHINTVRNWIKSGKLVTVKTPTGYNKIPASEMERILSNSTGGTQNEEGL